MRYFVQLWVIASTLMLGLAGGAHAQVQNFNVSALNTLSYIVDGQNNPPLTLMRGQTYTFTVNAPGHPFYIKTQAGAGTMNQFTDGVVGNGVQTGTLTFNVPASAPNQLFYQCAVHNAMSGSISIMGAAVPASAGWHPLLMCGALLLAGGLWIRGRRLWH